MATRTPAGAAVGPDRPGEGGTADDAVVPGPDHDRVRGVGRRTRFDGPGDDARGADAKVISPRFCPWLRTAVRIQYSFPGTDAEQSLS